MNTFVPETIKTRWSQKNGYKHILYIAFPLILSTGSFSIQQFVDRMFLSWYSPDALAAAMPTSILSFTLISLFMGTSMYTSTFVAQYIGANRPERVGPAVWQGIYFSIIGGVVLALFSIFPDPIFKLIGHETNIQELESEYWVYLTISGIFPIATGAMAGFFNGRGKTYPVMWASFAATSVNIILNYCLIFGNFGLPEMGIGGAGLATALSTMVNLVILTSLVFNKKNDSMYFVMRGWRLENNLFKRLIRFGLPNGIQFFLDIAAFSAFILLIGRLGTTELAASNVALNISMISFMPMIGLGITVSILVGQSLGADNPDMANRATYSSLQISFAYMGTLAVLYLAIPNVFIYPFSAQADPVEFEAIKDLAIVAMRFVAGWSIFDSLAIIFSSGLKGDGDTKFIMFTITILSLVLLIIPTYLIVEVLELGMTAVWSTGIIYVLGLGIAYYVRFKLGKWRTMRFIEKE
ncbi:MAG: MATE family efflux transporter [Dehalococcoidia bacterium]|nr:MATE family efflux transporter [Dehalococcoidia bacterium]